MSEKNCILIVDDDEGVLKSLPLILKKKDYLVESAATGKEAIAIAQGRIISLTLLDMKLPDFIGTQLLAPLKQTNPEMSIIMITGFASVENAVQSLTAGASGYITKPIDLDGMLVKIKTALDQQHLVTEVRRSEDALRESEARYSSLFDNSHSISLLTDPDTGMIIDANEAAARYYGYPRKQLTRMGISDLNRLDKNTVIQNLTLRKEEGPKHFFSTHYLASGEKRNVEVYSGLIMVHEKPLFYSIIHDVTDKRKAEEELQKSHQILEGILNTIPVSVFWKDKDLIYLGCNTPFAHDAGFEKPEDIIGKDDYAMGWHDQAELYRADDRLVIDTGKIKLLIEEPQTTPLGDRICLLTSKVPLKDTDGEIIGLLGSYLDITGRKLMEEEVRSLNRVLEHRVAERTEQLNASLEDKVLLLREIHHRVKNNLQIIASLLNLQSRYVTDKKVLETLRDSQSRVRAMALVHERIYQSPEIGTINLAEYLSYLINQLFAFYNIPKSQVEVSVAIDDIPADIDTAIPLGLIFNELVSNALKHAFPEGRKGKITVKGSEVAPDQLKFVFQDNGIGMSPYIDWKKSTSLGLRLVHSLTKQLNGTVEMEQDGGTVYMIIVKPKKPFGKHKDESRTKPEGDPDQLPLF